MNIEIKTSQRKVYRGFRRDYLTKISAAKSIAKALIDLHCACSFNEENETLTENARMGSLCKWHKDWQCNGGHNIRFKRIVRWVMRHQPKHQEKVFKRYRKSIGYGFKGRTLEEVN